MGYAKPVHLSYSTCYLLENMMSLPLCHPSVLEGLLKAVVEQVAPLRIPGHQISVPVQCESLDEVHDALVLVRLMHRPDFRYTVHLLLFFIKIGVHNFDRDSEPSDFVLCNHHFIARLLFYRAKDPVLVKLVFKALHAQDSIESGVTLFFACKKDLPSFISVKD